MLEMVEARVNSGETEKRHDLFSGLLHASQDELRNGAALNDEELIGKHPNVALFRVHQMRLARHPRKYVYLPSCWTRGGSVPLLRPHGS